MAITPKTVIRNPLLMILMMVVGLSAASFLCSGSSCPSQKQVKQTEFAKVRVATANRAASNQASHTQPVISSADRGWLGVHIQTLNRQRAEYSGVKMNQGVLVLDLQNSMPAQNAGFRPYDVITHFDGVQMRSACQLVSSVQAKAPGTRVAVNVNRNGVPVTLYPTLTKATTPASTCGTRSNCRK